MRTDKTIGTIFRLNAHAHAHTQYNILCACVIRKRRLYGTYSVHTCTPCYCVHAEATFTPQIKRDELARTHTSAFLHTLCKRPGTDNVRARTHAHGRVRVCARSRTRAHAHTHTRALTVEKNYAACSYTHTNTDVRAPRSRTHAHARTKGHGDRVLPRARARARSRALPARRFSRV